jgi:hypothetical protein
MEFEEEEVIERMRVSIDRKVLIQVLFIGLISLIVTGYCIYYFSSCLLTFSLSMIIGFTLGFLGIYFLLIAKPLFQVSVRTDESDEDIEFQSTMKI